MENNVVLKVENLTKAFGSRIAVNNISFEIKEGEIFGFLGPNGAGKTTTMRMITGLSKITKGEVYICGKSVRRDLEGALQYVGAIIENPLMFGYMTGLENLKYYASLSGKEALKNVQRVGEIVGLKNRLNDKVKHYSLGMRQRLGIAQALLNNPKLLILDEPLSGLDPAGVKEMREFLMNLAHKEKVSIIISSHMLSEMDLLCDIIGVINNGELIEVKKIQQLKQGIDKAKQIRIKVDYPNFAGSIIMKQLKLPVEIVGNSIIIKSTDKNLDKITKALVSNKVSIFGIEFLEKSLEEVFMDIINKKNNGKSSIL